MSRPCGDPCCTRHKMCLACFREWWKREVCGQQPEQLPRPIRKKAVQKCA